MRSVFRVALPVVIIVGLVAGISYIIQYTPPPPPTPKATRAIANEPTLLIPERTMVWDQTQPHYMREVEFGTINDFDFWVANPHQVAANVVLRGQSCSKCTQMKLGVVNSDAAFKAMQTRATLGVLHTISGQPGFVAAGLATAALASAIEWQPMSVNDLVRTVPPADGRLGMQLAIIRFHVDANALGPQRLSAEINYSGGNPHAAETRFEVPIVVVSPVQIAPNNIPLDNIQAGDVRVTNILLWSSTRDSFELELPKLTDSPNFIFSTPKRLTPDECRIASQRLPLVYPSQPPTHIRAAYAVDLTIYENINGQMLELGQFTKRLTFNAGTPLEAITTVTGLVRGDLRIESKNDDDAIALGDFRADLPFTKVVLVTPLKPNLKLKMVSFSPEALKPSFKERPGGGWELRLDIAANAISGPLPPGSSIILELSGTSSRKVRIPVTGVAFIP